MIFDIRYSWLRVYERERSYASYKSSEKDCNELIRLRDELASYMEAEQSQDIERDKKRSL